jgi:murein hydrolase activator
MSLAIRGAAALALVAASAGALPAGDAPAEPSRVATSGTPVPATRAAGPGDFERIVADLEREELTLKRQLDELAREADQAHARATARGRTYARLARAGLLPIGGGFDALVDHATRIERTRRALVRDLELEEQLIKRRLEVGKRLDELRVRRGPLEAQQKAMARAGAAVLAAEDRALAFERAFGNMSSPAGHTAIYGSDVGPTDPSELTSGFASLKGKLTFPLPGRSEIHSARRTDGPGLEMRAPRGTTVRAVYPGRVAFADRYADYGRTVIIDHGERYYTVSANLDEVSVHVGDDVSAGSRLGTVGDTGAGTMLYFEIRMGTEAVDPAEWFGI